MNKAAINSFAINSFVAGAAIYVAATTTAEATITSSLERWRAAHAVTNAEFQATGDVFNATVPVFASSWAEFNSAVQFVRHVKPEPRTNIAFYAYQADGLTKQYRVNFVDVEANFSASFKTRGVENSWLARADSVLTTETSAHSWYRRGVSGVSVVDFTAVSDSSKVYQDFMGLKAEFFTHAAPTIESGGVKYKYATANTGVELAANFNGTRVVYPRQSMSSYFLIDAASTHVKGVKAITNVGFLTTAVTDPGKIIDADLAVSFGTTGKVTRWVKPEVTSVAPMSVDMDGQRHVRLVDDLTIITGVDGGVTRGVRPIVDSAIETALAGSAVRVIKPVVDTALVADSQAGVIAIRGALAETELTLDAGTSVLSASRLAHADSNLEVNLQADLTRIVKVKSEATGAFTTAGAPEVITFLSPEPIVVDVDTNVYLRAGESLQADAARTLTTPSGSRTVGIAYDNRTLEV